MNKTKESKSKNRKFFEKIKKNFSYIHVILIIGGIVSIILLTINTAFYFSIPYVDNTNNIRNVVNEYGDRITMYAEDFKNNKESVINLEYDEVKINIKEENNIVNIYASKDISLYRKNTIQYTYINNNFNEVNVEADSVSNYIILCVSSVLISFLIVCSLYLVIEIIKYKLI